MIVTGENLCLVEQKVAFAAVVVVQHSVVK
jgi:hypothetical protein